LKFLKNLKIIHVKNFVDLELKNNIKQYLFRFRYLDDGKQEFIDLYLFLYYKLSNQFTK
jgi:hypothetical protein